MSKNRKADLVLMVNDHIHGALANSMTMAEVLVIDPSLGSEDSRVLLRNLAHCYFTIAETLATYSGCEWQWSLSDGREPN